MFSSVYVVLQVCVVIFDCVLCFTHLFCAFHIFVVFCISALCFVCLCFVLYLWASVGYYARLRSNTPISNGVVQNRCFLTHTYVYI